MFDPIQTRDLKVAQIQLPFGPLSLGLIGLLHVFKVSQITCRKWRICSTCTTCPTTLRVGAVVVEQHSSLFREKSSNFLDRLL